MPVKRGVLGVACVLCALVLTISCGGTTTDFESKCHAMKPPARVPKCTSEAPICDLTTGVGCCPGQRCVESSSGIRRCAVLEEECDLEDENACSAKGQQCLERPTLSVGRCSFLPCDASRACEGETTCFNGYCVGELPCNGGCGPDAVCFLANNNCFPLGDDRDVSCQQTCPARTMRVLDESIAPQALCKPLGRICKCEALPDFPSTER